MSTLAPQIKPIDCPLCERNSPAPVLISYKDLEWRQCPHCTFGFLFPYTSEEEQAKQKNKSQDPVSVSDQNPESTYANYQKSAHLFQTVAEEKAAWIQKHLASLPNPSSSVVIEIGPGLGSVLKKLRKKLPNQALLAVESQPRFCDHLQAEGFPVLKNIQALKNHPLTQKKHLVVFMDNVLEHIPRPAEFLKELKYLLATTNETKSRSLSVIVEVPNEFGIATKAKIQDIIRGFPKPPTFPGHINLFTEKTLGLCAQAANFQNIKITHQAIRNIAQIQYLSQSTQVSALAKVVVGGLNVIPIDRALGLAYWLRLECRSEIQARPQ